MNGAASLAPALELAQRNGVTFPNESAAYREARTALLAEEIELRRHIERVAEQRRTLPTGGEVKGDIVSKAKKARWISPVSSATSRHL